MRPDGFLTVEFALLEEYARDASVSDSLHHFWCALDALPELACLDIGAPSTLGGTLNTTAYDLDSDAIFTSNRFIQQTYATATNATSTNLFGQLDTCNGKVVGDGVINVFDIATLLAYHFGDYGYASLPAAPHSVATVQGRDDVSRRCADEGARVDYMVRYATDACDTSVETRRLQEVRPMTAATLVTEWRTRPPQPTLPAGAVPPARVFVPVPRHVVEVVPVRALGTAFHTLEREYDLAEGSWYTLRTASVALRMQAVFNGLSTTQVETQLSYHYFDGRAPSVDVHMRQVRFTRFCEFASCDASSRCAAIETVHASRTAMVGSTLELAQQPIARACPFEVHVWVPRGGATQCVNLNFLLVADGVRGQFARDAPCDDNHTTGPSVPPAPPPSPSPSPPTAPPTSSAVFPLWIVSVALVGASCAFCTCVSVWAARRRRRRDLAV